MDKTIKKTSIFILTVIVIIFLFSSCTGNATTSGSSTNIINTNSTEYNIKFYINNKQFSSLSLSQLHTLPEVTLSASGSTEQGPTLLSVLELAGINQYSMVKVSGMLKGRIATGELTLKLSEITDDVILDFNNQGKTKLCGTSIPDSNWIIDVAEIYAE